MTGPDLDTTRVVRAWLSEGRVDLSPRVLSGVLREFPATTQERPFWSPRHSKMSVFAAFAAAVIVLVAAVRVLPGVLPGGLVPATVPSPSEPSTPAPPAIDRSYRDVGFIGLPPLGLEPSGPDNAVLVENYWLPPTESPTVRHPYRGAVFLYADGRLIWNEYFDSEWKRPLDRSTGFLEQRLTSDGVRLVQMLAIEPYRDQPRRIDPALLPGLLPARAWVDETVRPYVPFGFAVCLSVSDVASAFGGPESYRVLSESLAEALPLLPADATDLLLDRRPPTSTAYGDRGEPFDCRSMSVADARRLDASLREAGLEQDEGRNQYLLEYHVDLDGEGPEYWWLNIWFEPLLPDGTITCSSCG